MPCSPAKARHLLKAGKAVVRRRTPFTIQLRIATGETKQNVTLGIDAGAKHVGISATTEKEEVFASEVELRQTLKDGTKIGYRKLNQTPHRVKNFRLFDKVRCLGQTGFIFGRRSSGYFDVRRLDGVKLSSGISYRKLTLLEKRSTYLTELRNEDGASSPV